MSKMEMMARDKRKGALVPRLRFPEFRDVGKWEIKKLSELIKVIIPPKKLLTSEYKKSGLFPIVDQSQKYIAGWTNDKFSIIDKHQAVIIFGDHTCILKLIESPFAQGADGIKIFYCPYYVLTKYIYQYILFNPIKMEKYKRHFSILKEKSITYPNDKIEQQRIADCLSSLDERIAAETSKLDRLKDHKKGLLKQLFPAEGETLPQLRFPEFRNAGEWENVQLGPQTTKVGSGVTPRGGDRNYIKQGRPFIRSQNVGWGELILDDIVFISEEIHRTFISTEIEKNDILLNITGASIGRSAFADSRIAGGNVNQHVCIIRTKPSLLNSLFLMQYILSEYGQKQVDSFQAGGNRQGLNFAQVKSFSIPTPPQSTVMQCACLEQQRIADCLSSLDELIAAQTQKIDLLNEHKKGLMQQLFPRIDEVLA